MDDIYEQANALERTHGVWGEHPIYKRKEWKEAIYRNRSQSSYWAWVAHQTKNRVVPPEPHNAAADTQEWLTTITDCEFVDFIGLVMDEAPTLDVISKWSTKDKMEVADWVGCSHLNASDNDDVKIPQKPSVILEWEKSLQ